MSVYRFGDQGAFRRRGRRARRRVTTTPGEQRPYVPAAPVAVPGHGRVFVLSWTLSAVCVVLMIPVLFVGWKASFGPLYALLLLPGAVGSLLFPFWRVRQAWQFQHALSDDDARLIEHG